MKFKITFNYKINIMVGFFNTYRGIKVIYSDNDFDSIKNSIETFEREFGHRITVLDLVEISKTPLKINNTILDEVLDFYLD